MRALLRLSVGAAAVSVASYTVQADPRIDTLLRREAFGDADLTALRAGTAVVKSVETHVRPELAVFGAVYVEVPTARFVDGFRAIERLVKSPRIPLIGRFSNPPTLGDLAALTLPAEDLASLPRCRPGDCDLKLPAATMTRFRNQVGWSSPTAAVQADQVAREVVLDLVRAYQATGNKALGQYDDASDARPVAEQFRALLASSTRLPVAVPELERYLDEYPRERPVGAEDVFYWSIVDFGLKPTIRVNHVVIYPLTARPYGASHVIAIKQLYASHYFHTALELMFLAADERRTDGGGFYLLSVIRSRSDGTTGLKGSLLRPIISRRSRSAVRSYLEYLKRQIERFTHHPR